MASKSSDAASDTHSSEKYQQSSQRSEDADKERCIEDDSANDGEEEEESDEEDPLYAQLNARYDLGIESPEPPAQEKPSNDTQSCQTSSNKSYFKNRPSSLKPILAEYGMEDPTKERRKRERQKRVARKRRESEGDDMKKEKAEQEYYIGVYDSLNKLRDTYYSVYLSKLQDRVEQQRKQIKKKSAELEEKIVKQNERPKFEKKLDRHELAHDSHYLQNIAKSETYKLVRYEEQLRSKGKLRYQYEVEEFWRLAREEPDTLRDMLKKEKIGEIKDPIPDHVSSYHGSHLSDSFSSTRASSYTSLHQERSQIDFRPMSQIEELKESSRPPTREPQSWAITAQFKAQNMQGPKLERKHSTFLSTESTNISRQPTQQSMATKKSVDSKPLDAYAKARLAAQELDKKFPQQELPPMSCFTMDLGDSGPEPEQILSQLHMGRRQKERKLFVKRIRKMFHLSQANTASTQRIMAKHGDDFELAVEGPTLDTMLSSYDLCQGARAPLTAEERLLQERPWLRHVRHRAIVPIAEESEPSVQGSVKHTKSAPSHRSSARESTMAVRGYTNSIRSLPSVSPNLRHPTAATPLLQGFYINTSLHNGRGGSSYAPSSNNFGSKNSLNFNQFGSGYNLHSKGEDSGRSCRSSKFSSEDNQARNEAMIDTPQRNHLGSVYNYHGNNVTSRSVRNRSGSQSGSSQLLKKITNDNKSVSALSSYPAAYDSNLTNVKDDPQWRKLWSSCANPFSITSKSDEPISAASNYTIIYDNECVNPKDDDQFSKTIKSGTLSSAIRKYNTMQQGENPAPEITKKQPWSKAPKGYNPFSSVSNSTIKQDDAKSPAAEKPAPDVITVPTGTLSPVKAAGRNKPLSALSNYTVVYEGDLTEECDWSDEEEYERQLQVQEYLVQKMKSRRRCSPTLPSTASFYNPSEFCSAMGINTPRNGDIKSRMGTSKLDTATPRQLEMTRSRVGTSKIDRITPQQSEITKARSRSVSRLGMTTPRRSSSMANYGKDDMNLKGFTPKHLNYIPKSRSVMMLTVKEGSFGSNDEVEIDENDRRSKDDGTSNSTVTHDATVGSTPKDFSTDEDFKESIEERGMTHQTIPNATKETKNQLIHDMRLKGVSETCGELSSSFKLGSPGPKGRQTDQSFTGIATTVDQDAHQNTKQGSVLSTKTFAFDVLESPKAGMQSTQSMEEKPSARAYSAWRHSAQSCFEASPTPIFHRATPAWKRQLRTTVSQNMRSIREQREKANLFNRQSAEERDTVIQSNHEATERNGTPSRVINKINLALQEKRTEARSTLPNGGSSKTKQPVVQVPKPPALSINSLTQNSQTVEAKCLSTMWSNYLAVGKSVFAK